MNVETIFFKDGTKEQTQHPYQYQYFGSSLLFSTNSSYLLQLSGGDKIMFCFLFFLVLLFMGKDFQKRRMGNARQERVEEVQEKQVICSFRKGQII